MDSPLEKDASAVTFGALLVRHRTELGLSLQDVSNRLLLSTNQVRGLEADNRQAFYNDWFYVQATKKYASFLNLPLPAEIVASLDQAALTNKQATGRIGLEQHPQNRQALGKFQLHESSDRRLSTMIAASFVVVGVIVGFVTFNELRTKDADLAQNETVENIQQVDKTAVASTAASDKNTDLADAQPSAAESTRPELTPTSETTASQTVASHQNLATQALNDVVQAPAHTVSELTLTFTGDCWVQATSTDGNRIEKIYKQGDTLQLNLTNLKSLVLGNATATSMSAGPVDVPLTDFTIRGGVVARILATDLLTHLDRTN